MTRLRETERRTLAALGILALAGLGALLWQRQLPPLTVVGSSTPTDAAQWEAALDEAKRVDVNAAGVAALERLPGVGPALAQRIVDHRRVHGRFRTADELQDVRGIGPGLYDSLRDYVAAE